MAEESICRNCFHSYVCEKFNENKDDNNKKCHFFNDHYVPQSDVVEVVRCKDCKHWANLYYDPITERNEGECNRPLGDYDCQEGTAENDFCSYGEKALKEREKE